MPGWLHHLAVYVTHHRVLTLACTIGVIVGVEGVVILWMAFKPRRRTPAVVKAMRAQRLRHRAPEDPTPAPAPERDAEPVGPPVEHEGASDRWADELRQLAQETGHLTPDPEMDDLTVDAERMHQLHAEAERRIAEYADQPIEWPGDYEAQLARVELRLARIEEALHHPRVGRAYLEAAIDEPTGQWDTAEYHRLLAAEAVPA